MKKLGANVVRVHLQLAKFMDAPDRPSGKALDRLGKLLALAERLRLYLDLTGLGCYHKKDVPAWYDRLQRVHVPAGPLQHAEHRGRVGAPPGADVPRCRFG